MTSLLSSVLPASSRRMYQSAGLVFRQVYANFHGCTNPFLPLPQTCISLFFFFFFVSFFSQICFFDYQIVFFAFSYGHKRRGLHYSTMSFFVLKLSIALVSGLWTSVCQLLNLFCMSHSALFMISISAFSFGDVSRRILRSFSHGWTGLQEHAEV